MGIECTTPKKVVDEFMNALPSIIDGEITRALSYLGEQCVKKVRDRAGTDSWFDQTGNLRSSIGYAVYGEGRKIIESAFSIVKQGSQGAEEGKRMIDELASRYAETYAMVVVAGMGYADAVEARENKDVLASTELWAKQEVNKYLNQAVERARSNILKLQQKFGL